MGRLQRRRLVALILLCALTFLFVLQLLFSYSEKKPLHPKEIYKAETALRSTSNTFELLPNMQQLHLIRPKREPLIFLYNTFFGSEDWESFWDSDMDGPGNIGSLRTLQDCSKKCSFTSDRRHFKSANYVLVHVLFYENFGFKPPSRKDLDGDQLWTAVQLESPYYGEGYESIDGIFHLIAFYRQDSDIFIPYGRYGPLNPNSTKPDASLAGLQSSLKAKRTAVFLASHHCEAKSERNVLVAALQRYVSVQVYGTCSGIPCPEQDRLTCREYLGQNYKFYLAFENSLCLDYVTEKVFLSYKYNMVPVTFGWVNYSQYLPPGSYINALEYESVEELGKHLAYLNEHEEEYMKYFSWRGNYVVEYLDMNKAMCTICQTMSSSYVKKKSELGYGGVLPQHGERGKKRYKSLKKWELALPAGKTSRLFRVGGKFVMNITGKACIEPYEYPEFQKWIKGD